VEPQDEQNTHSMQPVLTHVRRTWEGLVRSMIQVLIIAYSLLFMLFLVIRLSVGERNSLVAFADNFLPWLCWIGIGLGIVGLLFRDRLLLIGLQLPAAFTFMIMYGGQLLPSRSQSLSGEPTLTAVFYNVCG
jgi:hypothetical protein